MSSVNDNLGMSHNEEVAAEWCMRLTDGSLSVYEKHKLESWIATSPENGKLLEQMVTVMHHTNAIADMPGFLTLRAEALAAMDQGSAHQKSGVWTPRRHIVAVAMSLILLIAGTWDWSDQDIYVSEVGERRTIQLADGSKVSLDADSQIRVDYKDDRRMVVLDRGRAKFDVAKDPLRPFSVAAGTQAVVATGTSFSVELLQDQLRVFLFEGRVDVLPQQSLARSTTKAIPYKATASLDPGQELVATLRSGAGKIVDADIDRAKSWEAGRLDFTNIPLSQAVERFNRYSKVPIVVEDAAAGRKVINGVFDSGDVDSFVLGVTTLYELTSKSHDGHVSIKSVKNTENKQNIKIN